jgi:hypothetical protein
MLGWGTGCVEPEQRYVGSCTGASRSDATNPQDFEILAR